jgi:hemolysin activation/secretion protein
MGLGLAASAWSQQIPPSVEPGQVQRQLQQRRAPPPVAPQVFAPAPEQPLPEGASDIHFTLRGVEVSGSSVYGARAIESAFAPLIGHDTAVSEVFRAANALTARYRRDGYILSQVLVPAQDVSAGRVRLIVVEGFIDQVVYRGDVPADSPMLAGFARKLTAARPLTAAVLERYLLLMNDLGDTTARGTLVPAERVQGASDLLVDFARHHERTAVAGDNRNSRSLGPFRATSDLDWYGAASTWDHVGLSAGTTFNSDLNYAGLRYGSTLGHDGERWGLSVTGVYSRPGPAANLTVTDLHSNSVAGALQVDYPLLRSRAQNLYLRASLTSFDGRSVFETADVSDDHIRAARLGLSLDVADAWRGVNQLDLEFSQGLNILGARETGTASEPLSRAGGHADFSKITLYAARLQSLGGPWSGLLAVSGQQAFCTLLSPELFAYGGEPFGRGYDAAELVGDSGEAAKAELRFSGFTATTFVPAYSVYGFFDWGEVRRREPVNEPAREHASSAGLGARFSGARNSWQGYLELAKPLDHVVAAEGNRSLRVFFGVQVNL